MSTSSSLRRESPSVSAKRVTYNSADNTPTSGAQEMASNWKEWEGQFIAGFQLQRFLGGSEHSAVFLTESRRLGLAKAAIKLMPGDSDAAAAQLARWERAAKLVHPRLLRLYEAGRAESGEMQMLYAVSEVADEDLAQILPQRPITPGEAQEMIGPILEGLTYLHSNGLVHGHVKPSNVHAVADQLKLSSDSICAVGEPGGHFAGLREASPFDAPESLAQGMSRAADVWSLGATLSEALTLRLPAANDKPGAAPADPKLPEGMPQPFADIARNCLRRDAAQRWTVARIEARLQSGPEPLAKPAAPPSAVTPAPFARRAEKPAGETPAPKNSYLAPGVVAALVLVLLLGWKWHGSGGNPPAREPAKVEQIPPQEAPKATVEEPRSNPAPEASVAAPPAQSKPAPVAKPVRSAAAAPGSVLHQALPEVPAAARNTIQGRVRVGVKVNVDAAGNVTGASLESAGPSRYFARLALQAAQQWKFTPAEADGQPVPSAWVLHFAFGRGDTEVQPAPAKR